MARYEILFITFFMLSFINSISCQNHNHSESPELINAEVFFPNGSFVIVTINATVLENDYKYNPCPGVDMEALRQQRLEVLKIWVTRTNYDVPHLLNVYKTYGTSDILNNKISEYLNLLSIDEIGTFSALEVASEYAILAVDPNGVQLYSQLDPASIKWSNDNISLTYNIITNYTFKSSGITLDGFVNEQYLRYRPCTAEVWIDYSRQDTLVTRYLSSRSTSQSSPEEICDLVMSACTGVNQVYPTYAACLEYMTGVASNAEPCPSKYIGNTTTCHKFHANSAVYLPQVHCPHVRPYNSTVCRDFCLTRGCGDCDPNAECVFGNKFGSLVPKYECRCRDGYVGNGKTCSRVSCSATYQCPSNYNYASCNATCGCKTSGGFYWNSSQSAVNQNNACQCRDGENVYWNNGVPECIPIGRCHEVWQCPQADTQYNSIKCRKYGTNSVIPFNTCLCNYGYENLGFAYDCQCPAPGKEVWSNSQNSVLCLIPSECTENYHCTSGQCLIPPGKWLGVCSP
ncbi:hypothetical protein H012_gp213 [Acanthamoeba polyphaga moumouvirus]|uniref:EGF-like domain-containing protein n=1 Tax=Acanthamoeba polyphaga moumouvirus TaxID=1269028 RepID=L7RCD1_9VIRU|nr:hypothetical protein H012_gp213 [Acanthamoeba polyphaga moumouvirus]AGC02239.1 hypothetical protein Moumou_00718 [Acanthamoeba polyphaga moumouvirus]